MREDGGSSLKVMEKTLLKEKSDGGGEELGKHRGWKILKFSMGDRYKGKDVERMHKGGWKEVGRIPKKA